MYSAVFKRLNPLFHFEDGQAHAVSLGMGSGSIPSNRRKVSIRSHVEEKHFDSPSTAVDAKTVYNKAPCQTFQINGKEKADYYSFRGSPCPGSFSWKHELVLEGYSFLLLLLGRCLLPLGHYASESCLLRVMFLVSRTKQKGDSKQGPFTQKYSCFCR